MIFITRLHGSQLIVGEFLDSGLLDGWQAPEAAVAPGESSPHPGSAAGAAPDRTHPASDRTSVGGAPSAAAAPPLLAPHWPGRLIRGRLPRLRRGGGGP